MTSATSDKTAFAFHFFDAFHAFKNLEMMHDR